MDVWTKERILGKGSFGIVTLWRNSKTGQRIALKQCQLGLENSLSESQKRRWRKEIEIMYKLSFPNIVKAVPLPESLRNVVRSTLPVLSMEYCSKSDLRQVLNQPENCCGLPEKEVRKLLIGIKNALQYLHNLTITHRDLKPENILLQESAYGEIIYKLTDLGYAKELNQNGICSSFVGTLQYLAPELFLGEKYTNSVDYWSFGLVAHEVIVGIRPFLPQTPPVLWMKYVKNKQREHICVYQSTTGRIRYSTELFAENFVSQCFQQEIERWFQSSLEWDAKKRGVDSEDNVIIYKKLGELCDKKIVRLFCSITYNFLSYEVDSSTAITTLQRWIERDTKIDPKMLILLTYAGDKIDESKFAADYYAPEEDVMINIYKSDGMLLPSHVKPRFPGLVEKMLENPLEMLSFFYLKRTIAQSIYFLKKETWLFRSFLNAYKIKLSYVVSVSLKLNSVCDNMTLEINKILSNQKMSGKLLSFDLKCYKYLRENIRIDGCEQDNTIKEWQAMFQSLSGKIDDLLTRFHKLKTRCTKILENVNMVKCEFGTENSGFFRFEEFVKLSYKGYENLPSDRETLGTPIEAVKVVRDFLKHRHLVLKNEKFNNHLRNLHSCELDIEEIEKSLASLKNFVLSTKSDIMDIQFIRHKNMWQMMANVLSEKERVAEGRDVMGNQSQIEKPFHHLSFSNISKAVNHSVELPPLPENGDVNIESVQPNLSETEQMIMDNEYLRNKMMDSVQETLNRYIIMKNENNSIDWTFLNTDEKSSCGGDN